MKKVQLTIELPLKSCIIRIEFSKLTTLIVLACLINLCLINVVQLYSQKLYSKFDHITVDDGLSSNRIWSIYRDSKDYLWICTDLGLDKYDGYMFLKYRYNEKQPGSISSNNIRNIYEDSKNNLWFGSTEGLNLYDRTSGLFKVYKNIPSDSGSLNSNNVNSIMEDKNKNLWVLTGRNCLNKWNAKDHSFKKYNFFELNNDLYARPARMIAYDSKGYIWVVSGYPGIYRFEPATGKYTKFDDPSLDFGNNCYAAFGVDDVEPELKRVSVFAEIICHKKVDYHEWFEFKDSEGNIHGCRSRSRSPAAPAGR